VLADQSLDDLSQWRRNEIKIARPEGPKLEARWSGERCKLPPSGVLGEALAAKSFGAFWVLQVSSTEVLQLNLGVMNRDLQKFDYQSADKLGKLLRGRKDTFATPVSPLPGRAPPPLASVVPTSCTLA